MPACMAANAALPHTAHERRSSHRNTSFASAHALTARAIQTAYPPARQRMPVFLRTAYRAVIFALRRKPGICQYITRQQLEPHKQKTQLIAPSAANCPHLLPHSTHKPLPAANDPRDISPCGSFMVCEEKSGCPEPALAARQHPVVTVPDDSAPVTVLRMTVTGGIEPPRYASPYLPI